MTHVLAVDCGTSNLKAGVVSPTGDMLAHSRRPIQLHSPAEAAAVLPGPSYPVAKLRAGALRERGIDVVSAPTESGPPGHTEVPQLRYETRRCALQEGWQRLLAQVLCKEVLGPFPGRGARTGP